MPLIFKNQINNYTRIAVWQISEKEEILIDMLPVLKSPEKKFLNNISHLPRRLEWLASRVLIYKLTGLYPATQYNDNGQPVVSDCHENISISHTIGHAAILLSEKSVPGIDIEYPSARIEKVSGRFLNSEEKNYISKMERNHQLGIIWCVKEAIFKQTGHPGLIFKNHIIVDSFTPESSGTLWATVFVEGNEKRVQLGYYIDASYYLVWTT